MFVAPALKVSKDSKLVTVVWIRTSKSSPGLFSPKKDPEKFISWNTYIMIEKPPIMKKFKLKTRLQLLSNNIPEGWHALTYVAGIQFLFELKYHGHWSTQTLMLFLKNFNNYIILFRFITMMLSGIDNILQNIFEYSHT